MQTIDLKTMTTVELKATAYDQLVVARNAQQAAELINAEIELRGQTVTPEVLPEADEEKKDPECPSSPSESAL